jgi:hypothetical protein
MSGTLFCEEAARCLEVLRLLLFETDCRIIFCVMEQLSANVKRGVPLFDVVEPVKKKGVLSCRLL